MKELLGLCLLTWLLLGWLVLVWNVSHDQPKTIERAIWNEEQRPWERADRSYRVGGP